MFYLKKPNIQYLAALTHPLELNLSDLTFKHVKLGKVNPRSYEISHMQVLLYFPLSHATEINLCISGLMLIVILYIFIYVKHSVFWFHFFPAG